MSAGRGDIRRRAVRSLPAGEGGLWRQARSTGHQDDRDGWFGTTSIAGEADRGENGTCEECRRSSQPLSQHSREDAAFLDGELPPEVGGTASLDAGGQGGGEGVETEVTVLAPERTFWEKATIFHSENYRPLEGDRRPRAWSQLSRHAYDLVMLDRGGVAQRARST